MDYHERMIEVHNNVFEMDWEATMSDAIELAFLVRSLSCVELNRRNAIKSIEHYIKERDRHEKDAARILRKIIELEERLKRGKNSR